MSLDKAIAYGKEHRKPYQGAQVCDPASRNHGGDDYALNDRLHKYRKAEVSAQQQLQDLDLDSHRKDD